MGKLEAVNKCRIALGMKPRAVLIWFEEDGTPRRTPLYDLMGRGKRALEDL